MVYNDYELVSTKRVNQSRRNGMVLLKRQYAAMGGMPTIFTAAVFGAAGSVFSIQGNAYAPMVRPVMSGPGIQRLAMNSLLLAGPTLVGFWVGINAYGNPTEFRNLVRNFATYSGEMKAIKDAHYNC